MSEGKMTMSEFFDRNEGLSLDSTQMLVSLIDRIERFLAERDEVSGQIKEVFEEAKSHGFDNKIIREIIKLRKEDEDTRKQREALLATYKKALGME